METLMVMRNSVQKRSEGNPHGDGEGRSQSGRCAEGLEDSQSGFEQAFKGLQERNFQEDKINRIFAGLKIFSGFIFVIENLRKLNKHTKERQ